MKTRTYKVKVEIILEIPDDLLDATDSEREYSAERFVEAALEEMNLPEGSKVIKVFTQGYLSYEKENK